MSLAIHRFNQLKPEQLDELESCITAFYRNPPNSYYEIADQSSQHYTPKELPFHWDIAERVVPGATMLEMGCGTAHLCPHIESRGGHYTGMDFSEELIRQNRLRHPRARFQTIGTKLSETFDIVLSLYTIEHVVDPIGYLNSMCQYCKPGGLIAVVCPEFVDSPGLPPSVYYGTSPRRFREKVTGFRLLDACMHMIDLKVNAKRWKKQALDSAPGAFWINLKPSVLHGAQYAIDNDAVHFPRSKDLVWHLEQKGASIVQTSDRMSGVSPDILRFNCYVLARKPA